MKHLLPLLIPLLLAGCSQLFTLPYEEEPLVSSSPNVACDALAVDLFRELVQHNDRGNIIFSPASAEAVLQLLRGGAAGSTRAELDQLPFGDSGVVSATQVLSCQALFADTALELRPETPRVQRVPLRSAPELAARKINRWTRTHTGGHIKSVVSAQELASSSLLGISAVYLNELWLRPFLPEETRRAAFRLSGGGSVTVPMMYRRACFRYAETADWQAVALFYRRDGRAGEPACFIGILPKGEARSFAAALTVEQLSRIRSALASARPLEVEVYLPRMEAAPASFDLSPALQALGVRSAFDPAAADFSVLCESRLHVSLLRQQCCLKVNEQGTEASASSIFDLMVQSLPSPCPVIRFDRPFLWLIGDLTTAAPPYFMGLCEQP